MQTCQVEIDAVLKRNGCRLQITRVEVDGRVVQNAVQIVPNG